MVIYMLSLVLVGRTLGVTPPLPIAPYMTDTCTGLLSDECIAAVVDEHKLAQYSVFL